MFCSSCGGKLQEGAAFCPGCGTKSGGGAPAKAASTPVAPQAQTVTVRDFRCNGCGSPLKIPTNSNAPVKCPSCKTECLIDRAIKNAEIAAKENIESGIPLSATPNKLHSKVVTALSLASDIPLDVFEKIVVIREDHYCVPAYFFICNATESFIYDVANIRQHKTAIDSGDKTRVEKEEYEEWENARSSTAAVRKTILISGNRDLKKQIQILYEDLDIKELVDIEELIYPADVYTAKSDMPQTVAYNEIAVPLVETELRKKVEKSLEKQKFRGLQMAGATIKKETVRIFLGMYRVVLKYEDKEYTLWISGNGSRWFCDKGMPVDITRKKAVERKKESMEAELSAVPVPKTTGLAVGRGLFAIMLFVCVVVGAIITAVTGSEVGVIVGLMCTVLCCVGALICHVIRDKRIKQYSGQLFSIRSKYQKEIKDMELEADNVVQEFKSQKQALRGIYEGVSGVANAF